MLDLSTLNPPQREAVMTTEGPLLVLAGAGSGKTRVIAHRVAYLLVQGVDPEQVLAVTFTNKAAGEMRERVAALAGPPGVDVFVSTFHSFGLWLLQQEHEAAGLPRRFAICDAGDQLALVKRCMREVSVDDRKFDAHRVLSLLSRAKNAGKKRIVPREAGQGDDYDLVAAEVYPRYEKALRAMRSVDFDDLIARPVAMLAHDPALRARCQERFRYLLVDEYQDTNAAQLELLKLLAGERRNVCAVGDDDQAIYGWRGAEVKNILRFERHFPGAKEVRLEQNYRSTGHILACANAVIAKNAARKAKALFTAGEAGEPVRVVAMSEEEDEARFVAEEIARQRGEGRPWSHFAVLFRLNALSRPFEEAFREGSMPYKVHGGPAFFDRSEVRDLLAYLKLCVQPEDDVSLSRVVNVPPRGIGDTSMERVHDWAIPRKLHLLEAMRRAAEIPDLPRGAAEKIGAFVALVDRFQARFREGPVSEAARALVAEVDLFSHVRAGVQSLEAGSRRVDALEGLLRSLDGYVQRTARPSLATWLQRLALDSREEEDPSGEGGITLMTLHAAKGLEFPVVFLVGVEEDYLPCAGIQGEARDLDEERRLAYVGITRARERLYLTRVAARSKRGKLLPRTPSRFLDDLPPAAHEKVDPAALAAPPQDVAAHTESVMAALRARLGGR
ncbi:UvrD/REP helicase [Anaeromyxobacter dehalogenans 2CP-1]|uniref:DNA 3'-5' helicase n=1 Tax=Anaeromyxobacter dehalogenans (strain ATCC BAA-258 / DSM 21875 / 2CP-1) TaxID=455488 RepID=B8J5I8_ANAD2|nr:UvrD-helicase domain-containing protein [Anaeromyxobacter dehalogenans]ACL66850.1 UvrD/REP helicase [Anaeromyxobacter dehalogenans 2CP-1]